ncbi:hypothetical protein [Cupriavidus metallidurans]|uniref:hypothetical protein n=1 Tax=Cupriavidus metallidurans TaxID=119219 RepID=UPI001BFC904A|nr:hypothetical protein [Cupriavidus metallidurans]QWC91224.1 hypothetical protein KB891_27390 [Cupriavidus metallidurans]
MYLEDLGTGERAAPNLILLLLPGFEQRLEIAFAKAALTASLDAMQCVRWRYQGPVMGLLRLTPVAPRTR